MVAARLETECQYNRLAASVAPAATVLRHTVPQCGAAQWQLVRNRRPSWYADTSVGKLKMPLELCGQTQPMQLQGSERSCQ